MLLRATNYGQGIEAVQLKKLVVWTVIAPLTVLRRKLKIDESQISVPFINDNVAFGQVMMMPACSVHGNKDFIAQESPEILQTFKGVLSSRMKRREVGNLQLIWGERGR